MPSTRSSHRAAQAAINTKPLQTRTLRPLPHRLDNGRARSKAPASHSQKTPNLDGKVVIVLDDDNLNNTTKNAKANTRTRARSALSKPSNKTCEADAIIKDDALNGNKTTANTFFTAPVGVLTEPFVAPVRSTPLYGRFLERFDDDVPSYLESLEAAEKKQAGIITVGVSTYASAFNFQSLKHKTWSLQLTFVATMIMLVMSLVSISNIYAFLAPAKFATEEQHDPPICRPALDIHNIAAQSWGLFTVDFALSHFETPSENIQDPFLMCSENFFMPSEAEEGYDGGDEHDDEIDDFPDDESDNDSCIWVPREGSHFLKYKKTWDMTPLIRGIDRIEYLSYRTPSNAEEDDSDVQEYLAQMMAGQQEDDSGSEWSDNDEKPMEDPFNVPAGYVNNDEPMPRANKGMGNCREWYYEGLDTPVPFPGYDVDSTRSTPEFVDNGINEVVEIEDPWGYDGAEDERLCPIIGWNPFPGGRAIYAQEIYPRSAWLDDVLYLSDGPSDREREEESDHEVDYPEEAHSYDEADDIPEPPSYLWASMDED